MKYFISVFFMLFIISITMPSFAKRKQGPGSMDIVLAAETSVVSTIELTRSKTRFHGEAIGGVVDYFLYDNSGKLVASDISVYNTCDLYYTPTYNGLHYFKVKNYDLESSRAVIYVD